MGMFDTVVFTCPKCGDSVEEQTKIGECYLAKYDSNHVPPFISQHLEGEITWCQGCGTQFTMHQLVKPNTVPMYLKEVL